MNKYCLLTNDVETTSIWFNVLRDETGLKVLNEGMPVLLSLYEKHGIKTTFFYWPYCEALSCTSKNGFAVWAAAYLWTAASGNLVGSSWPSCMKVLDVVII